MKKMRKNDRNELSPAAVLDGAADLLVDLGWTQGQSERDGRHCAVGAVEAYVSARVDQFSFEGKNARRDALDLLREAIPARYGGGIVEWNDVRSRTRAQVVRTMRLAATRARRAAARARRK